MIEPNAPSAPKSHLQEEVLTAVTEFRALGLHSRIINTLISAKIRTLSNLKEYSEASLLEIPGIGRKTIEQLRLYIRQDEQAKCQLWPAAVAMTFEPSLVDEIDAWAKQFEGISRAEAIRHLIKLGLRVAPLGDFSDGFRLRAQEKKVRI